MQDFQPHLHPNTARYTADELEYILILVKSFENSCRNSERNRWGEGLSYGTIADHLRRILDPVAYDKWVKEECEF